MVLQINDVLIHFLTLTIKTELLWIIIPLFITTVIMVIYFQVYKSEHPEWSAYLANSLVLLFISISLFRYIYGIDAGGAYNFVEYWQKTAGTGLILLIGAILLRFNFEHLLPERFARQLSSPVTINIFAYVVILFIYSTRNFNLSFLISLIFIYAVLYLFFYYLRYPMRFAAKYVKKEKRKDRLRDVREAVYQTDELKKELKSRTKELRQVKLKEIEEEKEEALKKKSILKLIIQQKKAVSKKP